MKLFTCSKLVPCIVMLHVSMTVDSTLCRLHTMAVNQAVTSLGRNVLLDDRPPPIKISEKELTQKERTTLAQLRSGHCRLLGSYKSRISKDVSLDVCADCGKTPHDVKHLFNCPAHPTTMTPSDLWNRPVDAIRELSYLEAGILDWDGPDWKANNNNCRLWEHHGEGLGPIQIQSFILTFSHHNVDQLLQFFCFCDYYCVISIPQIIDHSATNPETCLMFIDSLTSPLCLTAACWFQYRLASNFMSWDSMSRDESKSNSDVCYTVSNALL